MYMYSVCVCLCVCICICLHSVCVVNRGSLVGVCSLLPRDKTQFIRLDTEPCWQADLEPQIPSFTSWGWGWEVCTTMFDFAVLGTKPRVLRMLGAGFMHSISWANCPALQWTSMMVNACAHGVNNDWRYNWCARMWGVGCHANPPISLRLDISYCEHRECSLEPH